MGLFTLLFLLALVLLVAFTALYLGKSLQKKPEFLSRAVDKITAHIDQVALAGVVYGFIILILTLVAGYEGLNMFIRFVASLLIILMALPYVFERAVAKFREKIKNPAIIDEARNIVGWITKQEKYIGYAGAVFSLLLFAVIF